MSVAAASAVPEPAAAALLFSAVGRALLQSVACANPLAEAGCPIRRSLRIANARRASVVAP